MADILTSPDTVVVFAQAIAGLGHLRVTQALYQGLPKGTHAVLLGTQDTNITLVHNLTSRNMTLRRIVEYFETGPAQDVFALLYGSWLRSHTKNLQLQLTTILERHPRVPKTLLVVATHFGLAHQLGALKAAFSKEHDVRMILAVVVTDDAPFHVWAVRGADITVVPSDTTKWALKRYLPGDYIVLPYMVSPRLTVLLSEEKQQNRVNQLNKTGSAPIHVAIPISGAAVQLSYLSTLIRELANASDRFMFHIIAKESRATAGFLANLSKVNRVELTTSVHDREVVEQYEQLYEREVIALEVTKPSEQAFKALIAPDKIGGSILLLSDPVGLQEKMNLAFLARHGLLGEGRRALQLPADPNESARAIFTWLQSGMFARMAAFSAYEKNPGIADDGVTRFWELMRRSLAE